MKGTFLVKNVTDQGTLGLVLNGVVSSGQLKSGMEARYGSIVIIISELRKTDKKADEISRARKGQKVHLRPMRTVYELLKAVEGKVLEFEELKSLPIEKPLVLKVDPT